MKLSLGSRILMFAHWLLSLVICVAFTAYLIVPDFVTRLYAGMESSAGRTAMRIIGVALLVIYAALVVGVAILIFRRKHHADKGFITVDSSDSGKVRIAVSAIEQLVRQSVDNIDGITNMQIDIENQDDAIGIVVNASIVSGSHVPTITMNMQRSIRQFVEMNCGVAVRTVSISINAVSNAPDASRRRHAHPKAEAAPQYVPQTPEEPEADQAKAPAYEEDDDTPRWSEAAPSMPEEAEETVEAGEDDDATAYDFDKPFVSEFAKDLMAMKAAEAAKAAESAETGDADAETPEKDETL